MYIHVHPIINYSTIKVSVMSCMSTSNHNTEQVMQDTATRHNTILLTGTTATLQAQ